MDICICIWICVCEYVCEFTYMKKKTQLRWSLEKMDGTHEVLGHENAFIKKRKKEKGDLNSLKDRRPRNHSKNNPENHLLDLQPSNNGLHHSKERTWHLHLKRVTFQKNQNYNFTKKNWWPLPKLNGITWLNNKLQHISKSYTSLIDVIQEYINTSEPRTQKNISISLQNDEVNDHRASSWWTVSRWDSRNLAWNNRNLQQSQVTTRFESLRPIILQGILDSRWIKNQSMNFERFNQQLNIRKTA